MYLIALFCTLIIDAHKGRKVSTFYIPGSYLHAEMPKDERLLMKLRGYFFYIMCQVNPKYKQHMRYENGKNVLYLLVFRAIYGCIYSALFWYNMFSTMLKGVGFEINPYDICVTNKTIEGMQ